MHVVLEGAAGARRCFWDMLSEDVEGVKTKMVRFSALEVSSV